MARNQRLIACAASLVFLAIWAWVAFDGSARNQSLIGFYMTALGGITAGLGELAGSAFGGRGSAPAGTPPPGAWLRAVGFIVLTLGALLMGLPPANEGAGDTTGDLADPYLVASGVLICLTVLGLIIAYSVGSQHAELAAHGDRQNSTDQPK